MKPVDAIETADLFPELHAQLIELLNRLSPDDWYKPTACGPWSVKDVVAHLVDGQIRRLSFQRDNLPLPQPETPISDPEELIGFLDQLNADWIRAAKRISPTLLITMLELVGPQIHHLFKTLPPNEPAFFSVGWAGEDLSLNRFDIAREYTEQWHHQQHIREAVGQPLLMAPHQLFPVLDTFMRGLPATYQPVEAADGQHLSIFITGDGGGEWSLLRQDKRWQLYRGSAADPATQITLDQDTAWRLFTKGLTIKEAKQRTEIKGNQTLGTPFLSMVSIMA